LQNKKSPFLLYGCSIAEQATLTDEKDILNNSN